MELNLRNPGGVPRTFKEIPFLIAGPTDFGPFYPPNRIQISKERNLKREDSMCGGEDITDNGSKNREIHISGKIRRSEISVFNDLLDENGKLDLITAGFKGEIRVRQGEFEGPVDWDAEHQEWLYDYSLDVVSTGREEGEMHRNGIVDDGSPDFDEDYSDSDEDGWNGPAGGGV